MVGEAHAAELDRRFGKAGAVRFAVSPLGGTVAHLTWRDAEATVALFGAHVLSWRTAVREQLWLSPAARLDSGKPVRGGIPVCWPWFGAHEIFTGLPSHGLVRTRQWQVTETGAESHGASIALGMVEGAGRIGGWPEGATATVRIVLGEGLTISLETHNAGSAPIRLTSALHTYFAVSDIAEVRIDGLGGCTYLDKLDDGARRQQQGAIRFAGEVDRIYLGDTAHMRLHDDGPGARHVEIASEGSRSAVVWNPWLEKAARLGDMGTAEAYRHMVCIETANAGDDVVTLAPGGRHTLTARYTAGR